MVGNSVAFCVVARPNVQLLYISLILYGHISKLFGKNKYNKAIWFAVNALLKAKGAEPKE